MNTMAKWICILCAFFATYMPAETIRVFAVNTGSATRYGDFAADTNTGDWYGLDGATNLAELEGAAPTEIYQTLKYNPSALSYTVTPLQPGGTYTLRMHYNDAWTDHTFSLSLNGTQIESSFNPYVEAGYRTQYAVIREYPVQIPDDGILNIAFARAGGGCGR